MSGPASLPKEPLMPIWALLIFLNSVLSSEVKTALGGGESRDKGLSHLPSLMSSVHDKEELRKTFPTNICMYYA